MNRASQFRLLAVLFAVTLMPFLLEAENPGAKKLTVSLAKPVPYNAGAPYADSVAIADVNGDGIPDLILADFCQSLGLNGCTGTGQAAVLLGNGDGTFQPAITYSTGGYLAYSVRIASLNSGEVPALVVANLCLNLDQYGDCTGIGGVGVLLGNGDGTFQPAVAYSTGGDGALSVAVGNLDDEEPDLVIANVYGSDGSDSSAAVLLNNGDGTFQSAVNYGSGGYQADWVEIADMNGDGIQDLVLSNLCQAEGCYTDGEVAVLLGNGDGTFQPATTYESGGPVSYSVAAADLRGNGIMDVVITNRFNGGSAAKNSVSVLLGNGDGTLQPAQAYLLSGFQFDAVAIGDLNGDGIPDLAVIEECQTLIHHEGCGGTGLISVLLGNGDGTFQPPAKYGSGGYEGSGIAIADVNGDGRPDVVVTNACSDQSCTSGAAAVLLNGTSYASKTVLSASPNPAKSDQPVTFTAIITPTPPNGELVTFSNGKTILGTGTTASGTATLTTSLSAAKTYTIKAAYPGDPFRKKSSGTTKLVVNP